MHPSGSESGRIAIDQFQPSTESLRHTFRIATELTNLATRIELLLTDQLDREYQGAVDAVGQALRQVVTCYDALRQFHQLEGSVAAQAQLESSQQLRVVQDTLHEIQSLIVRLSELSQPTPSLEQPVWLEDGKQVAPVAAWLDQLRPAQRHLMSPPQDIPSSVSLPIDLPAADPRADVRNQLAVSQTLAINLGVATTTLLDHARDIFQSQIESDRRRQDVLQSWERFSSLIRDIKTEYDIADQFAATAKQLSPAVRKPPTEPYTGDPQPMQHVSEGELVTPVRADAPTHKPKRRPPKHRTHLLAAGNVV